MTHKRSSGGGFSALKYALMKSADSGLLDTINQVMSKNTCKTCALGMGGQKGGMKDETGSFPQACKKSFQAVAADLQDPISEDVFTSNSIATLGAMSSRELDSLGRIGFPLIAVEGATHFARISWDEAIDSIVGKMLSVDPKQTFFYSSGRSSNEAAFLLQWIARVYGTNNVINCSFYCHQASSVGLSQALGSGTSAVTLEDLKGADLAIVIGSNPSSNHPRMLTHLVELKRNGGKIIVVNPLKELGLTRFKVPTNVRSMLFGSKVADLYIQPRIGGDIALLKGVAKIILETGQIDEDFIENHTEGWNTFKSEIEATGWGEILQGSGVQRAEIEEFAALYGEAKNAIFMWAMGLTHHAHGVNNILACVNLALTRHMIARENAGLLAIRGHSNVQGVGSVGFTPALKKAFGEAMEKHYGLTIPKEKGLNTLDNITAAYEGKREFAFLLGGNLFSSNPDREYTKKAMEKIGMTVYLSTQMNEGHIHGRGKTSIILPARTRDEEAQGTTQESMFNFIRLSDGGTRPKSEEMRSEIDIISEVASKALRNGPIKWEAFRNHSSIRKAIGKVVPGFKMISDIDRTKEEFHVGGRILRKPYFPTTNGKAAFIVTPIPTLDLEPGQFHMMSIRSEGQFNTVVYEEEDIYRHQTRRDVVMMNEADASGLGLREDSKVTVRNDVGTLNNLLVRYVDIHTGNVVVYYPECQVLVPRISDPKSGTPIFKSIPIWIER